MQNFMTFYVLASLSEVQALLNCLDAVHRQMNRQSLELLYQIVF
jgi:hypothetical protein